LPVNVFPKSTIFSKREMLSRQRHEIIQSLYYYAKSESDYLIDDKLTREEYDAQQIHLASLLEDLSSNDIIKIYKVQRRHCIHQNFIIILADHSHFYTCMLLINCGLICQHF